VNAEAWNDLMSAAGSTPYLESAACRSEVWMADLTDRSPEDMLDGAEAVCHRCPRDTAAACAAWVDRLEPHLRPAGYAAGRLLGQPPAPPRLKADPADDPRWLAAYLGGRPGHAAPAEQVVAAASAAGIPESRLRRARKRCGVTVSTGTAGPVWVFSGVERVAS
jgi:hypothetical protein